MITRQFYKVKQLYDESVRQGEKTELLPADLAQVDKTVELMKTTFTDTRKKLKSSMVNTFDESKKMKNVNHKLVLAQTFMEVSEKFSKESLLSTILCKCGQSIATLAGELTNFELRLEDEVLKPIQGYLENELDSIDKLKKKLSKLRLDLDASRSRYLAYQKQGASKDKIGQVECEVDQLLSKFETTQDTLATEILTFVSREREYSLIFIKLMKAKMEYHKNSLEHIVSALPELEKIAEKSIFQPVFGMSLESHFKIFGQEISFVLEECVNFLLEHGLEVEGLFRVAGSSLRLKKIKAGFDSGVLNLSDETIDVHSITGALKQYLRELPEPLFTFSFANEWLTVAGIEKSDRPKAIKELLEKIPKINYINIKFLMSFFNEVSLRSDKNKMPSSNLAIVIAPNLLWSQDESKTMMFTSAASSVVESMIEKFSLIFPNSDITIPESNSSVTHNEDISVRRPVKSRPPPVTPVQPPPPRRGM